MLRDLFSLFPAYAGVIPYVKEHPEYRDAFPRIRGGDPARLFFVNLTFFFSPHTRG